MIYHITKATAHPPYVIVILVEAALDDKLVFLMSISAYILITGAEKQPEVIVVISLGLAQHSSEVEAIT